MKKSTLSTFGLLLLSTAHVACGGAGGSSSGAEQGDAFGGESSSGGSRGVALGEGGKASSSAGAQNAGQAGSDSNHAGASDDGESGPPTRLVDSDSDGVGDDRDLCPGTASGVKVTPAGCELAADKAAQIPWGQPIPASAAQVTPATGSVEVNGFMSFVVDPRGPLPMVFRARASSVQELEHGYHVTGAVLLDVPGGNITLAEADVTFELGGSIADGVTKLSGSARVPFPDFGAPESVELETPMAKLGLELGRNLAELKAPLQDERRYLYFDFSDQLSAKVGAMVIQMPAATEHLLVLDHSDPMFFVRASLSGMPGMPVEIKDAGIGFSRQGRLPFTPTNTWGLAEGNGLPAGPLGFSGQMYLEMSGGVQIPETPLMITGESVNIIDLDPARSGRTVFTDPENGLRLGANRALGVKLELIPGTAEFELQMGQASLDLSLLKSKKTAAISGVVYPGKSFFNDVVPILPLAEVKVAAAIASPLSDSRFALGGDVSMQLSKLNDLTGLSLSDVPLGSSVITVDKNGLTVHGGTSASFLSAIGMHGDATFDAVFPGNAASSNWFVDMNGEVSIAGVRLQGTTSAHLDRNGVAVAGRLATALGGIAMAGRIDEAGVRLSGTADITIPIVAGRTEVQTVVNGAVCGYSQVTSAVLCGTKLLTGWSECGVSYAKSCVLHGKCGTPTCDGPAKTCPDFGKPLSCPQVVTIPAYNFGTFRGAVRVDIGTDGARGSVIGAFCSVAGDCTSVPSSVDLSASRACVQVPGAGTFCVAY